MPTTQNYITQDSADARYQALGGLSSSTPSTVDAGDTGTAGASSSASRADHEHPVSVTSAQLVPAAWLAAWTSYTPTDTNITVGNGTRTATWVQKGKLVAFRYELVWGSTTSFGGNIAVGLPTAARSGQRSAVSAVIVDLGTRFYAATGLVGQVSATVAEIYHTEAGNSGLTNATNPQTWATGDILVVTGTYEAA